ncbi:MAG: hypothetical protein ACKO90_30905, partial [Microcystis panniformis]
TVLIDNKFPLDDIEIGEGGEWKAEFVFLQAGDRIVKIAIDNQSVEIKIKAILTMRSPACKKTNSAFYSPPSSILISSRGN